VALDVDPVDVEGMWLRYLPHRADPRDRPFPPGNGRWQRGAVVDALYLADAQLTVWAEWYRHLAERGLAPLHHLPRDLWRYHVPATSVADLSDVDRLRNVGLEMPLPGRQTWRPYQAVGEQVWREGWPGLLSPSAARPEGRVLCLFVDDPGALPARPFGRPRVVSEPPVPPTGMRT
jgi:RES domain-containing protein